MMSEKSLDQFLREIGFKTRSNASPGLWLMFLLPASLISSVLKHPVVSTPVYKLSAGLATGIICSSLVFYYRTLQRKRVWLFDNYILLACFLTALFFWSTLHKSIIFSLLSGVAATVFYQTVFHFILRNLAHSFTLGEAAIASQVLVFLLYSMFANIFQNMVPISNMGIATMMIQVGLFGIGVITLLVWKLNLKSPNQFYSIVLFVVLFVILVPLHFLLGRSPLLWIINLMTGDTETIKLILFWSVSSAIAAVAINTQIKTNTKATTSARKVFHILAVVTFLPGFLCNCLFLYLASGVVLGIFFALEIVRILKMPPIGEYLQQGFTMFVDEKDSGIVALTPIYLLVGSSLPLWIHPSPCDITNSAIFNLLPLLSGLLTTGIGDSAASIIGSRFGKHHWPGSEKSIEGTVACVLSQSFTIFILVFFEYLKLSSLEISKAASAVVVTSLLEACTDQIDNLVLPLVMYIILI